MKKMDTRNLMKVLRLAQMCLLQNSYKVFLYGIISLLFFWNTNVFAQNNMDKVGQWNLYVQGAFPNEALFELEDGKYDNYKSSFLLNIDTTSIDSIFLIFVDTFEVNLQRYKINRLEITKKNGIKYNLVVGADDSDSIIRFIYPNLLNKDVIAFKKVSSGIEFVLQEDYLNSSIKIFVEHINKSKSKYYGKVYIEDNIYVNKLGNYQILLTPNFGR